MIGVITVPYVWHATAFEILWLVSGLISTALNISNLKDSKEDFELLEVIKKDPTVHDRHYQMIKVAASGRKNSQVIRIAISLLIVLSGVVGVVNANPLGGETTWTGLAITLSLLGIAIFTGVKGLLDYYIREHLLELAQGRSDVIAAKMLENEKRKHEEKQ